MRVIVIGAGIAGLTAAYRLLRSGADVTLLEASDRAGGRMKSLLRDGRIVDCGAQFLSTGYRAILPLINELGLQNELQTVSAEGAIFRAGRPRTIRGALSFSDWLRLRAALRRFRRPLRTLPLDDYSAWEQFDDVNCAEWLTAQGLERVLEYLVEPMLEGYYFTAPENTSLALAMVLFAFAVRRSQILTFRSGLGVLPETLASRTAAKMNVSVRAVRQRGTAVTVQTESETLEADYAVLATPAPIARRLLSDASELEESLLATQYNATVLVNVTLDRYWRIPDRLRHIYGILAPRSERRAVAAITFEGRKEQNRAPAGEVLNVMLCGTAGRELISAPEELIVKRLLPDLDEIVPHVSEAIRDVAVVRWPEAEPQSPVGRARAIASYRRLWHLRHHRTVLAGDYVSMPFTDGAVEGGIWAAQALMTSGT